jgi:hypothetical protein
MAVVQCCANRNSKKADAPHGRGIAESSSQIAALLAWLTLLAVVPAASALEIVAGAAVAAAPAM